MPELLTLIKYQGKQAFRNSSEDKFIKYHHYKSATKVLYYGKMSLNLIFIIKRNMFCYSFKIYSSFNRLSKFPRLDYFIIPLWFFYPLEDEVHLEFIVKSIRTA
jgi:hypothetical protein